MSEMTDQEVVQILAVFDGRCKPDEIHRIHQCGTALTEEERKKVDLWFISPQSGHGTEEILEYLSSYDAVASVLDKAWEYGIGNDNTLGTRTIDLLGLSNAHPLQLYPGRSAGEIARALAQAIKDSKR